MGTYHPANLRPQRRVAGTLGGEASTGVLDVGGNRFYHRDCVRGASQFLADDSVDLIVTDPPYGIKGDKLHQHYNRDEDYVVEGYVEIPAEEYRAFTATWVEQATRVLRPGGSMFIVSGYTHLLEILEALRRSELEEVNHIIWKYNFGVYTSRKFVSSHYHILYYAKRGGPRTFNLQSRFGRQEKGPKGGSSNYADREDVWLINRENKPGKEKNKNELPTELLIKLIQYASNPDDVVCDFFLGGFSTARVAIGLGRRATGFEVSTEAFHRCGASLRSVRPGELLPQLRAPDISTHTPHRRSWSTAEDRNLRRRVLELQVKRTPKKVIVATLAKEIDRGPFAITKAIKRLGLSKERPKEPRPARPARMRR